MPAGTPTQLTADVFVDNWVNWFPDGRTVILSRSGPDHEPRLMTKSVIDVGPPSALADLPGFHYHAAVSPDGETVVYVESGNLFVWSGQAAVRQASPVCRHAAPSPRDCYHAGHMDAAVAVSAPAATQPPPAAAQVFAARRRLADRMFQGALLLTPLEGSASHISLAVCPQ